MKYSFGTARLDELPEWALGPDGTAVQIAIGNSEDASLEELEDTLKLFSPFTCTDDALDALGRRFKLPRYPGEPNGTAPPAPGQRGTGYRGRLCNVWQIKLGQGVKLGIVEELQAYGIPDVVVYEAHELAFLPANPIGYDPNRSPPWYTAVLVALGPNFGTTGIGPLLAPFVGGPQCTSGSTATRDQVRTICGIVLAQKNVAAYPVGVVLRFGATALGGINTVAPFTPAAVPQYCFWNIGKLARVNIFNGPFTPGGFDF